MLSWLAPFVVLTVFLMLFFYGAKRRAGVQDAMKSDLNFYLVCVLAVAIVSIIASMQYDKDWMDVAVWVLAAVAIAAMVWRFASVTPVEKQEDTRGPLEQNDQLNDRRGS